MGEPWGANADLCLFKSTVIFSCESRVRLYAFASRAALHHARIKVSGGVYSLLLWWGEGMRKGEREVTQKRV